MAAKAPAHAKAAMYARAKVYLERFLTMHTSKDLSRTRATLALEKVQEAVAKLTTPTPAKTTKPTKPTKAPPGTVPPGKWIDLLPLVDPAKDAVKGAWQHQAGSLALTAPVPNGRIRLPIAPRGSYELQVRFVRTSGDSTVSLILPVGSAQVGLLLNHVHGQASGLELVNGRSLQKGNETCVRPGTLQNGREYSLGVQVVSQGDQARVAVTLDGKPYITWHGPPSALSLFNTWRLPDSRHIGLGATDSVVAWRSVRLRMLAGEATLLRPEGK